MWRMHKLGDLRISSWECVPCFLKGGENYSYLELLEVLLKLLRLFYGLGFSAGSANLN
jgi:hypothetical protein